MPRLDMMSSGTLGVGMITSEAGEEGSGCLGFRRAGSGEHSRGGDDLILGSPDQQHGALVPSENRVVRMEGLDGAGMRVTTNLSPLPWQPALTQQ